MPKTNIKYKYKFDKKYNPKYTNGALGGINSLGEIIINFYLERSPLPHSQTFEIKGDKIITQESIQHEPEDFNNSLIRMVQSGVIMNYQTAKEIHRWLGQHIEQLEKLTNEIEK
jgi:hypothetical protein